MNSTEKSEANIYFVTMTLSSKKLLSTEFYDLYFENHFKNVLDEIPGIYR